MAKNRIRQIRNSLMTRRCKKLAEQYSLPGGYKRVYHYHIRKTGGTSINHVFLSVGGLNGSEVYARIPQTPNYCVVVDDKVFVGWNRRLIEQGNYFYAFSHLPMHQLSLPPHTFTFTCLRDPVKRALSFYRMLLEYKINGEYRADLEEQSMYLGDSFSTFLLQVPQEHLLCQLYMFSHAYNVDDAFEHITACSYFFFTEEFARGIEALSARLGLELYPIHIRKTGVSFKPDADDLHRLRSMLEPELVLYKRLQEYKQDAP